ncbi:uncharacterized protein LOC141907514 [Tubulanus polymorphus]|uniref:uncharacterized protein LOC141907514 n=1 Tax=Tubulanus polymorphus TaxID=672921 RepID=UPI003DA659F1
MDFLTTVPHACYLSSHNRHTAPTKYITDKPTDWVYVERQCPGDLRSSFYDLEQGKNFEQSTRLLNTATVATPSECAVLCLGEQYCRSFDVKPAEVEQLCHLYGDYATSLSNLRSTIGGFYGSMDKRLEDFNRP